MHLIKAICQVKKYVFIQRLHVFFLFFHKNTLTFLFLSNITSMERLK